MAYTLDLFSSKTSLDIQTTSVHSLSMEANRFLWQQQLCNMYTKGMGRTSKVVNGILPFSSDTELDGYDVCFT